MSIQIRNPDELVQYPPSNNDVSTQQEYAYIAQFDAFTIFYKCKEN